MKLEYQLTDSQVGVRNLNRPVDKILANIRTDIALLSAYKNNIDLIDVLEGVQEVLLRIDKTLKHLKGKVQ